ncbi:uncharacterized protein M421DRAFT_5733 [Didymella exigua CBS 183.55]|uniref:Uncharacterized protein n=1 Tax=Didymella exigua CBS 183.55 TaxID=1150837 RepID=A0A6A5RIB4_9PLEO|nr:uncharacterized protein M421DRAFT_5733 [Didymella exigua CBS 183.55]KAF1928085.1 hypothetical protein M421DRAFT_5733 [Didymella exigua CBS 183.55]
MRRLIVPHEDPSSPLGTTIDVDFPRGPELTWTDFHPELHGSSALPSPQDRISSGPQWRRVADEIDDVRARFINHNPIGFHPRCSSVDRSAVLVVYNEALVKLEHASNIDAIKIYLEVKTKVSTILDLREAKPDDAVFYIKSAFLSPLEPHYAQPRLDYYDRGFSDGDDSFYRSGIGRLVEWRKGGWPNIYPAEAVEREMRERERRASMSLIEIHGDDLLKAQTANPLDWGEEVDADSNRPWR